MTVTIFSLKDEKGVYAYSINKEYIDLFKIQRNMDLFYIKKVKMSKHEFMIFSNKNRNQLMIRDYLFDGESECNIEMITTVYESDALTESCTQIHSLATHIENSIFTYPLKDKYLNIITKLTSTITDVDEHDNVLNIDTFKLFYHLFRKTFSKDAEMINNNI